MSLTICEGPGEDTGCGGHVFVLIREVRDIAKPYVGNEKAWVEVVVRVYCAGCGREKGVFPAEFPEKREP